MALTGDPVNYRSFCGVALQNAAGTPVKAKYELDFISETLHGVGEPIRRKSVNRKRSVKGAVMGAYSIEGDISLEVTPDKFSTLLYAALTAYTEPGTTTDPYTHIFKPGDSLKPLSVHIQRANQLFLYPDLYVNRLSFRGVIDAILEATVGLQGRGLEKVFDTEQSGGSGALASTADPFVFWGATVSLHGGATTDTNNHEVTINTGLTRAKGLGAGRAHNRAHPGDSLVEGSFDLVFDTIEEHRRWMGAATSDYTTTGIQVANTLQTLALQLKYTQSASRVLTIDVPRAYYKASGPAVPGREGIVMQRCEWSSLYSDDPNFGDVVITLKNGETATDVKGFGDGF